MIRVWWLRLWERGLINTIGVGYVATVNNNIVTRKVWESLEEWLAYLLRLQRQTYRKEGNNVITYISKHALWTIIARHRIQYKELNEQIISKQTRGRTSITNVLLKIKTKQKKWRHNHIKMWWVELMQYKRANNYVSIRTNISSLPI